MKRYLCQLLEYFRYIWEGKDRKPSIKRILALFFSWDFISNTAFAIKKWEAGKSYADVAMLLGIEAGLIAAMLGLTSYFNLKERELSAKNGEVPQGGLE